MGKPSFAGYRRCYALLLRLYPADFQARYGESMRQTFHDLLRDRAVTGRGVLGYAVGVFAETMAAILRQNSSHFIMRYASILRLGLVVLSLLLVPLVAMQFTSEVSWSTGDFAVAGSLLFGSGLVYLWIAPKVPQLGYRLAVGAAVLTALALIWVNLAVGIIGAEDNPANLLYLGVLVVGGVIALLFRFAARGMVRALVAMALAQGLVAISSAIGDYPRSALVDLCFIVLWLGSAALFFRCRSPRSVSEPTVPG